MMSKSKSKNKHLEFINILTIEKNVIVLCFGGSLGIKVKQLLVSRFMQFAASRIKQKNVSANSVRRLHFLSLASLCSLPISVYTSLYQMTNWCIMADFQTLNYRYSFRT